MRCSRIILFFLLLCSPAWAVKTIHSMAADMTDGNGDGTTKANAMDFATAKTAAALDPGDTIELYDDMGDFPAVTFGAVADEEGTAESHITIRAFTGETPKFAGPVYFENYTVDQYIDWIGVEFYAGTSYRACQVYGGGNMTFTDCKFYGPLNTWTSVYGPCLSYRAAGLGYGLIIGTPSPTTTMNDVTLTRCTFQAYRGLNVVTIPRNLTITDCIFQNGAADLAVINGFMGVSITGCTFGDANYRRYAQWNDANQDGDQDAGGTVTGTFTVGNYVRQAVSNAVGRVDAVLSGIVLFNQMTATDFLSNVLSINSGGVAVNKGGTPAKVGIPITAHTFSAGETVTIANTVNYDGTYTIDSVSTNEIVIESAYTAETFGSNDTCTGERTISEYDSTNTTPTGNTITGTFKVDYAGHPDGLQINPGFLPVISAIEQDQPSEGLTRITVSSYLYNYCQTGEKVYITGLTGAQAGGINGSEWAVTRIDSTMFSIEYNWPDGAEITCAATSYAMPVMSNLTISRNTFDTTAYQYSAIDLILTKASTVACDGITIENNVVKGNYAVGAWFDGINTRLHDNFVVNNNTFMNTAATSGIRLGFTTMATYGGGVVSKMYNNLSVGILITGDTGDGTWVVTAHDNNSFGTADNVTQDPSDIWTPGANDDHSVDFSTDWFTNYAGGVFALKAGSLGIDDGNATTFATLDRLGVTRDASPDRGAYEYVAPAGGALISIIKLITGE